MKLSCFCSFWLIKEDVGLFFKNLWAHSGTKQNVKINSVQFYLYSAFSCRRCHEAGLEMYIPDARGRGDSGEGIFPETT